MCIYNLHYRGTYRAKHFVYRLHQPSAAHSLTGSRGGRRKVGKLCASLFRAANKRAPALCSRAGLNLVATSTDAVAERPVRHRSLSLSPSEHRCHREARHGFISVSSSVGIPVVPSVLPDSPQRKKDSHAGILVLQKRSVPVSLEGIPYQSKPFLIIRQETTSQILNIHLCTEILNAKLFVIFWWNVHLPSIYFTVARWHWMERRGNHRKLEHVQIHYKNV